MKKLFVFLLLNVCIFSYSQEDAWVYFTDKPGSQTYLDNPLTMLSQRALDRRIHQSIALEMSDVPIYQPYIDQIQAAAGITVKAKSKWLNCIHVRGLQSNINALQLFNFVQSIVYANKNLNSATAKLIQGSKSITVETTKGATVNFSYGNSLNQIQMLNGHLLHQSNYTGTGKVIAVLDSGFPGVNTAQTFQRLRDNNQILGGYNYVSKSANFYSGGSHGTSVLSLMGGYTAGELIGTAPDAQYYLYVTEDSATENPVEESNWVEAAEEADRVGADIITTSLGYFSYDNAAYSHLYSDMTGNSAFASKGANIAFAKGILVVASAGNDGASPVEPHIGVPAEALHVLAVGAVKADRTYATFSSIGPSYDNRVKPEVVAQGQFPYLYYGTTINNTGSGTSFSCPILAGMIACLWQALPTKTAAQIKQLVLQSSDNFAEPAIQSRIQYGYGIPNFSAALSQALANTTIENLNFMLYPNPANDTLWVTFPKEANDRKITIYTLLGQKVLEENATQIKTSLSLKSLMAGTYFYSVQYNGVLQTGKIMKQ